MRRALDGLYGVMAVLATVCLVAIAALTLSQVVARSFGWVVPSADDFAGFAMAAASFLGLAHTLRHGAHVRVNLLLSKLPRTNRHRLEMLCLATAVATLAFVALYAGQLVYFAYKFNEFTIGLVPIPKWIPMLTMVVGMVVFAIAFLDDLIRVVRGQPPSYGEGEGGEAVELEPIVAQPGKRR